MLKFHREQKKKGYRATDFPNTVPHRQSAFDVAIHILIVGCTFNVFSENL